MSNIHLLCGIPASGKSSWAAAAVAQTNGIIISRDKIRYSLLSEKDEYFAKEKEVFSTFIYSINEALKKGYEDIYIDATHVTQSSREKVLRSINTNGHNLYCEVFSIDFFTALRRNSNRSGRECVPESALFNMFKSFSFPLFDEFENAGFNLIIINTHEQPKEGEECAVGDIGSTL